MSAAWIRNSWHKQLNTHPQKLAKDLQANEVVLTHERTLAPHARTQHSNTSTGIFWSIVSVLFTHAQS